MEVRMATGLVGQPMRRPRLIHAAILLVTSGLTTLATAILGPSLPRMQAHFSGAAHADYLVPLTLTVPMLAMAALSIFAGSLADRYGRKRMLVWSTAISGMMSPVRIRRPVSGSLTPVCWGSKTARDSNCATWIGRPCVHVSPWSVDRMTATLNSVRWGSIRMSLNTSIRSPFGSTAI